LSEFDLDGFIGEASDHYAAKHPVTGDNPGRRVDRAFTRLKRDYEVRDRNERRTAPQTFLRESKDIWTPNG